MFLHIFSDLSQLNSISFRFGLIVFIDLFRNFSGFFLKNIRKDKYLAELILFFTSPHLTLQIFE